MCFQRQLVNMSYKTNPKVQKGELINQDDPDSEIIRNISCLCSDGAAHQPDLPLPSEPIPSLRLDL